MKRFLSSLLIAMMLLTQSTVVFAEESEAEIEVRDELAIAVENSRLLWQLKEKLAKLEYRLYTLENNLDVAQDGLVDVRRAVRETEEKIEAIDRRIKLKQKEILNVKSQMERKRMELAELEEEVQVLGEELRDQKEVVSELMTLIYMKRSIYYQNGEVDAVKLLASPDSVSGTLQGLTYLGLIEQESQDQIAVMAKLSDELKVSWDEIRVKRTELENLDAKLAKELVRLQAERTELMMLWEELRAEQAVYEAMIDGADHREEDLRSQVAIYKQNVRAMESKLRNAKEGLSQEEMTILRSIETEMFESFSYDEVLNAVDFDSPLPYGLRGVNNPDAKLEITAYFIDQGYVNAFGVQHYALDMRAMQGTDVLASADGVVQEVVYDPDSTRYGYVKIAHRKGLITVYGHMNEVEVEAGDYVYQGDVIGQSGGMPGTVGAGARTTGPHLHFEVWHDGLRVDPLMYLPLDLFVMDDLPEEFQALVEEQLKDKIRVASSKS